MSPAPSWKSGFLADIVDCYITGLLSALDSLFNEPLEVLVEPLPLDARFKRALLGRGSPLGEVLGCVIAFESGNWMPGEGMPAADEMNRAFWDAGRGEYARATMAQMAGAAEA